MSVNYFCQDNLTLRVKNEREKGRKGEREKGRRGDESSVKLSDLRVSVVKKDLNKPIIL
ncbi:MAG: hypothetical protein IPH69_09030 [Bacteroidales bacterium]|nr:hypothetical protein [Bacteroidales bacterium]